MLSLSRWDKGKSVSVLQKARSAGSSSVAHIQ